MSATIRTYSKSCKHNLHFSKYGNQQRSFKIALGSTHFHRTTLCTYICSIIQIQSISLQKIINNNTESPTVILHFWDLNSINWKWFLHSYEAMVIKFLLQLESPNLDHQNSSYCILHLDYSIWHNRICT